ncbi:hypothetical protein OG625_36625 [Streptomyces sp. NBC_01351]|uniref:hypothetical protein n=1 Tax=Streptomyces sp. NBC_01351 TaxID=2903833 RepID=UPI002E300836|nr:hypothetical protein [Streptomyces sp. NBC_01351]
MRQNPLDGRPEGAAPRARVAASAALALAAWGLTEWWNPRRHEDPGYVGPL